MCFAGQISGVEGYMESAASGIAAAFFMAAAINGEQLPPFPDITMIGALSRYISDGSVKVFSRWRKFRDTSAAAYCNKG